MDILPSLSGSWSIKFPSSDSWSISRLPSLFEMGESHDGNLSSESESCSSYDSSDESDDEFLLVQENYMIIATNRNSSNDGGIDNSDDLSDIAESYATSANASTISGSSCLTSGNSCSARQQQPRHAQAAQLQSDLAAITEESSTIEESDPCEAYLRAKMTSLWTRIQESAQTEELTATPSTERDAELLRAYERKNDSLIFLMKHL